MDVVMTKKEPKSSVLDEQFGETENTESKPKKSAKKAKVKEKIPASTKKKTVKKAPVTGSEKKKKKIDIHKSDDTPISDSDKVKKDIKGSPETATQEPEEVIEDVRTENSEVDISAGNPDNSDSIESTVDKHFIKKSTKRHKGEADEESVAHDDSTGEATPAKYIPEQIDYTQLSKEDLVKILSDLIGTGMIANIRRDIETIKSCFYKKHKSEIEEIRKKFLTEGGQIQDFKVEETPLEVELKDLLNRYRDLRNDVSKKVEDNKVSSLEEKYKIIEGIKELVNSQESLNKTFQEFRDLQNRWREMGPVPQQNIKDLWESYHYHVEAFYDYIKINKELRDLDLKKNLEAKIVLCITAEGLLLEPSVVEAFRKLQKLHDQWREIGPVPIEKRAEIWERFKETTTIINRKHQEYFVSLKHDQKKNFEEKLMLCEKAEEIQATEPLNHKEWETKSSELIELQKMWKTIGFAPKKYNTQVYERFRQACDSFFVKKREYYSQNREEQQNNLQLKTELCIQAEGIRESTDWKKTTDELIALQKRWKEIGPVPLKQSEKIWKRFRAACDSFFENKIKFYSTVDTRYEENLERKNKLIEEIEKFEPTTNVEKNLQALQEYQRLWAEIGYVPIKFKNEIQDHYRLALNNKFDQLKLDENKKSLLKFRNRVEDMVSKPNSQHRMQIERDKCFNKLKQLESDITLWENNIGFFAKSKNAKSMIDDVNNKIEQTKLKIEQLKGKIRMLDDFED
jgi:hypothetical protein